MLRSILSLHQWPYSQVKRYLYCLCQAEDTWVRWTDRSSHEREDKDDKEGFQLGITLLWLKKKKKMKKKKQQKTGMFGARCGILHTQVHTHCLGVNLVFFVFFFLNQLCMSGVWGWLLVSHQWKGINTRQRDTDRNNPSCLDSWQQMLLAESHSLTHSV